MYDCIYVALAKREAATLVTADEELFQKVKRGMPEITIDLLA